MIELTEIVDFFYRKQTFISLRGSKYYENGKNRFEKRKN